MIISTHHSQKSTFICSITIHLSFLLFLWIGAMIGAGSAGNPLKRENKRSPLLWWSIPLKRPAWAWLNLSHNQEPTIRQTLPLQTYYCTGARYSCGESHLGVRGNKCFFNWNSGISSCFLPMLYESPVPIVWKFALTSPWRPQLIERVVCLDQVQEE